MEKRIGTITIHMADRAQAPAINNLISTEADIILCRQGLPFHRSEIAVISLIVEGTVDRINALTGQLGRLNGVTCKAVVVKSAPCGE